MSEPHKRKGAFTSEFILAAITAALSLAIMGGWVDVEGATITDKIAAMVAMALASLGYTAGRSFVKGKTAEANSGFIDEE